MLSVPLSLRPGVILAGAAQGAAALLAGILMSSCSSTPKAEVIVSVKDQKMGVYSDGHLLKQYPVSTSKFGVGDQPNSYRTPLGKAEVIAKIGHGLPPGAVLKSRSWNGEVLKPNAPGRDPVVSRILWLRGMERTNRNAMNRYIYIHGTTEEDRLGKPASYGCIRMGMRDVVEVFNEVSIGAKVIVTKTSLPHVKPVAPPKEEPAAAAETPMIAAASAKANAGANAAASAAPIPAAEPMKAATGASADAEREHAKRKEAKTVAVKAPETKAAKKDKDKATDKGAEASAPPRVVVKNKGHKEPAKESSKSVTASKRKQVIASTDKVRS